MNFAFFIFFSPLYCSQVQLAHDSNTQTVAPHPSETIKSHLKALAQKKGSSKEQSEKEIIDAIIAFEKKGVTLSDNTKKTEHDFRLLHDALQAESLSAFKALIEHGGISPNVTFRKRTILMVAIDKPQIEFVMYLLTFPHLAINTQNYDGNTALVLTALNILNASRTDSPRAMARKNEFIKIFEALLKANAHTQGIEDFIDPVSRKYNDDIAKIMSNVKNK